MMNSLGSKVKIDVCKGVSTVNYRPEYYSDQIGSETNFICLKKARDSKFYDFCEVELKLNCIDKCEVDCTLRNNLDLSSIHFPNWQKSKHSLIPRSQTDFHALLEGIGIVLPLFETDYIFAKKTLTEIDFLFFAQKLVKVLPHSSSMYSISLFNHLAEMLFSERYHSMDMTGFLTVASTLKCNEYLLISKLAQIDRWIKIESQMPSEVDNRFHLILDHCPGTVETGNIQLNFNFKNLIETIK